jgi:hypothetical protein
VFFEKYYKKGNNFSAVKYSLFEVPGRIQAPGLPWAGREMQFPV